MKKYLILLLLITAPVAVQAKDFRALSIGESCERVIEAEEALGSSLAGIDEEKSFFRFRGSVQGWPATIAYFCGEGKFRSGLYFLDRTSFAEATASYAEIKNKLILEYGMPTSDLASLELQRKAEEWSGRALHETQTYICMWENGSVVISLSIEGPFGEEWNTDLSVRTSGGI
jgi:hypothetical protein